MSQWNEKIGYCVKKINTFGAKVWKMKECLHYCISVEEAEINLCW